jgi:OOP family OmpA-OmpF porin
MKTIHQNGIAVAVLVFLLGACKGPGLQVKPITGPENPADIVGKLDRDMGDAVKNQVHILSPGWFAKANASLEEAKKRLDAREELSKIYEKVSEGRAQLQRAQEMANLARTTLKDTIKARDLALAAGAPNLGADYTAAERRFLELTQAIERNNLSFAQDRRDSVAATFQDLELRAIKDSTLNEVRRIIARAEKANARKIAPRSLATAQRKLADTDAFISGNRYSTEKINEKAKDALFYAGRLTVVLDQSEKIKNMRPEDVTLWAEGILQHATQSVGAPDMRNEDFDTQVKNLVGSITALRKDQQFMASKVKEQQETIAGLRSKSEEQEKQAQRLEAEKRFNRLFTEVQGYFTSREAEVYKQGNNLLIRLRGIQFPVGKEVIMPDNYALLSKVQRSIRVFGEPRVVIEGHTDATGTDALNEQLSIKRAEAVRMYFVANGILKPEQVQSYGYGSARPLAPNTTADGRALNRRIDLLIIPVVRSGS